MSFNETNLRLLILFVLGVLSGLAIAGAKDQLLQEREEEEITNTTNNE